MHTGPLINYRGVTRDTANLSIKPPSFLKMKTVITGIVMMLYTSFCLAGSNDCELWEYAKLKDAKKIKLIENYCSTSGWVITNRALADASTKYYETIKQEPTSEAKIRIRELLDGALTCVRQAEAAVDMLESKFKASRPTAVDCVCLGVGHDDGTIECPAKKKKK
jgi:hypothetical protein